MPPPTRVVFRIEELLEAFMKEEGDGIVFVSARALEDWSTAGTLESELRGRLYWYLATGYQHMDPVGRDPHPDDEWQPAQHPYAGLISGVADYVRYTADAVPEGARPNPSGSWNDGFATTALFLRWVSEREPDFVYELNQSMSGADGLAWSPALLEQRTGWSIDALWDEYGRSFD